MILAFSLELMQDLSCTKKVDIVNHLFPRSILLFYPFSFSFKTRNMCAVTKESYTFELDVAIHRL